MFFTRIIILFWLLSTAPLTAANRFVSITINNNSSHEIKTPTELLFPTQVWDGTFLPTKAPANIKPGKKIALTISVAAKNDLCFVLRGISYPEALAEDNEPYTDMVIKEAEITLPATYCHQNVIITITPDDTMEVTLEYIAYWADEPQIIKKVSVSIDF